MRATHARVALYICLNTESKQATFEMPGAPKTLLTSQGDQQEMSQLSQVQGQCMAQSLYKEVPPPQINQINLSAYEDGALVMTPTVSVERWFPVKSLSEGAED